MASGLVFLSPTAVYTEKQIQDQTIDFLKALEASIQSMTSLSMLSLILSDSL